MSSCITGRSNLTAPQILLSDGEIELLLNPNSVALTYNRSQCIKKIYDRDIFASMLRFAIRDDASSDEEKCVDVYHFDDGGIEYIYFLEKDIRMLLNLFFKNSTIQ